MNDFHPLLDLGAPTALLYILLRELFLFRARKNGSNINMRELAQQIRDLHKWHDQRDTDGVFAWYVRRSLETAVVKLGEGIDNLASNVQKQTTLLERVLTERRM